MSPQLFKSELCSNMDRGTFKLTESKTKSLSSKNQGRNIT